MKHILIFVFLTVSPIMPIMGQQSCPSPGGPDRYFYVGRTKVQVPARFNALAIQFGLTPDSPRQGADPASGCWPPRIRNDWVGLPLDTEFPETVYPYLRSRWGQSGGRESWSSALLYALPPSRAALEVLRRTDGSGRLPPTSWQPDRRHLPPADSLKLTSITSGPYTHNGVSGSYSAKPGTAAQPNGAPLRFICDPGQKWTFCTISYALLPGLGLQYSIYFISIDARDPNWKPNLANHIIQSDRDIRAAVLEFVSKD